MTLVHAALLLLLAFVLLVLELFLPSGGLLGLGATAAVVAAIVIGFLHSFTVGCGILILVALGIPLTVWLVLKLWPRTPIGKRMLNVDPEAEAARRAEQEAARRLLLGRRGVAKMDLLPNGRIVLDGKAFDAVSVGGLIERGEPIEVVNVVAGKIQVRKAAQPAAPIGCVRDRGVSDRDPGRAAPTPEPATDRGDTSGPEAVDQRPAPEPPDRRQPQPKEPATPLHPLEVPLESLGIEDWDEPPR